MKHSKTFLYFNNIINQCESDHLLPLSRAVNECLKQPSEESLSRVNEVFSVIEASIIKITEDLHLHILKANQDITPQEKQVLQDSLFSLHDNVKWEIESLNDVIKVTL